MTYCGPSTVVEGPQFHISDVMEPSDSLLLLGDDGLGRGEPSDRHTERRAGHVVEPGLVEEVDRVRITTVLTTDT